MLPQILHFSALFLNKLFVLELFRFELLLVLKKHLLNVLFLEYQSPFQLFGLFFSICGGIKNRSIFRTKLLFELLHFLSLLLKSHFQSLKRLFLFTNLFKVLLLGFQKFCPPVILQLFLRFFELFSTNLVELLLFLYHLDLLLVARDLLLQALVLLPDLILKMMRRLLIRLMLLYLSRKIADFLFKTSNLLTLLACGAL